MGTGSFAMTMGTGSFVMTEEPVPIAMRGGVYGKASQKAEFVMRPLRGRASVAAKQKAAARPIVLA